jgi:hypothetical protein
VNIKTLVKWGLIIVVLGLVIDSLSTILSNLPFLILLTASIFIVFKLKKKFFRK